MARSLSNLAACVVLLGVLAPACSREPPLPSNPVVIMPPPTPGQLQPDADHPMFWRHRGEPVMLLGGSVEDNLFQLVAADLDPHLDLLASVGGNYVRCTMSPRDPGNVQPHFLDDATGKYDLERWSDEYWRRFEHFLDATARRGIAVQIEVWDRFDLANEPWLKSSFNPANNATYTTEDTGLEHQYDNHPGRIDHPFFRTVPALDNNQSLLRHQQRFVDRLLDATLQHDHVLYCIDNETTVKPAWPEYWATYIQTRAAREGKHVYCTEMWDPWAINHEMHRRTSDRPDLYRFVDVSQNNHMDGDAHYALLLGYRQRIVASGIPRPINNVKVYGADTHTFGPDAMGVQRFWQNIFGGAASTRFHRPPHGIGLDDLAQANIKAARAFVEAFPVFHAQPSWDHFSRNRQRDEAYLLHVPDTVADHGPAFAVYFPTTGDITIQAGPGPWQVRWLHIPTAAWREPQPLEPDRNQLQLVTPEHETTGWVAVITRR